LVATEVIDASLLPPDRSSRMLRALEARRSSLDHATPYHGYLKNVSLALTGKLDPALHRAVDAVHIKFWSKHTLDRSAAYGSGSLPASRFTRRPLPYLEKHDSHQRQDPHEPVDRDPDVQRTRQSSASVLRVSSRWRRAVYRRFRHVDGTLDIADSHHAPHLSIPLKQKRQTSGLGARQSPSYPNGILALDADHGSPNGCLPAKS